MTLYMKPAKILEHLNLLMGIVLTIEDPISRQPITLSYENLHSLLVIDMDQLPLEGQIVANLYAEMARFQRACEFAADRAEFRYAQWKSAKVDEFRSKASRAAPAPEPEPAAEPEAAAPGKKPKAAKAPAAPKATVADGEAYYRGHPDYLALAEEPKRLRAIAGLFEDLKWGFKMKSENMRDANKTVGGYGATDRDGDAAGASAEPSPRFASMTERLNEYTSFAQEASRLSQESGASEAMKQLLAGLPPAPTTAPTQAPAQRTATPLE